VHEGSVQVHRSQRVEVHGDFDLVAARLAADPARYLVGQDPHQRHHLVRVGPAPVLTKRVIVSVGAAARDDDAVTVPIAWRPTGRLPLFPDLQGTIRLVRPAAGAEGMTLRIETVYVPPLGSLGVIVDDAFLSAMVTDTLRRFLMEAAERLVTDPGLPHRPPATPGTPTDPARS
jgi:hypothetical protein